MEYNYENFLKLQERIKKLKKQRDNYKKCYIETLKLFDFDKSAYLSVEAMNKIMGKEFLIYETKVLNVVEGRN